MALENLFIRTEKSLNGIRLDAIVDESHANTTRVTVNPIEAGVDVVDHSIIERKKLTLNVAVSDTPVGIAAFSEIVDFVTGLFGTATETNLTRSNAAYNALTVLQDRRQLIEVKTNLVDYTNMLITNISITQNARSSRTAIMRIDLEEILIIESEVRALSAEELGTGVTNEQASASTNLGRAQAVTPTSNNESSVLKSVTDWIF